MSIVTTGTTIRTPPWTGRVLIVEDDPNSRWALCAILKRIGFECRTADDGRQALAAVANDAPDVILMDLMMPVLDGLETTRRLKADATTRSIPILALTANDTPSGRSDARSAGCDDFIPKPIVLEVLLQRIGRHLRR
jgi:DNA-binding response OmpR family regulator